MKRLLFLILLLFGTFAYSDHEIQDSGTCQGGLCWGTMTQWKDTSNGNTIRSASQLYPFPVTITNQSGTAKTCTGTGTTITLTNAAQDYTLLASNVNRTMIDIRNISVAASITLNPTGIAYSAGTYTGYPVPASGGTIYDANKGVPSNAIHAASTSAGATVFVVECNLP